jgi:hypothetical protein
LLLSPLYTTAFHLDGEAYTYRTASVHAEDGEIVVDAPDDARVNEGYVAGVACTEPRWTRGCGLDRHVASHGPITAATGFDGGPAFTRIDGVYYRRVAVDADDADGAAEQVRLDLERVTAQEVLDGVDVSRSSLTWPGRVVLLTGGVTTTYPLTHGGYVVDTGAGHRLVYLTEYERAGGTGDDLLSIVGVISGAWLVVRGYGELPRE